MTPDEARDLIRARITVTPQRVTIAKAIILELAKTISSSDELIRQLLSANGSAIPRPVILHESVDSMVAVVAAGDALSWRLAGAEAIWSLIHSGMLLPLSEPRGDAISIDWTTVVPGSGGVSAGWRFEETRLPVPDSVRRAPSLDGADGQFLAEPDLYLNSLGIPTMHDDVASSFREAVKCFRAELYTASIAMLGKASEGSWLELGDALLSAAPDEEQQKYSKQRNVLEDPMAGPFRKIEAVLAVYEHQELFAPVAKATGIRPKELRVAAVWSDAVRDSRNTIHFGAQAALPNTYEKLAALLIGAAPHIKTLYQVRDCVRATFT